MEKFLNLFSSKIIFTSEPLYKILLIDSMTIGYCVKCRAKREITGAQSTVLKNGTPAIEGTCPTCETKMFRIGKVEIVKPVLDQTIISPQNEESSHWNFLSQVRKIFP